MKLLELPEYVIDLYVDADNSPVVIPRDIDTQPAFITTLVININSSDIFGNPPKKSNPAIALSVLVSEFVSACLDLSYIVVRTGIYTGTFVPKNISDLCMSAIIPHIRLCLRLEIDIRLLLHDPDEPQPKSSFWSSSSESWQDMWPDSTHLPSLYISGAIVTQTQYEGPPPFRCAYLPQKSSDEFIGTSRFDPRWAVLVGEIISRSNIVALAYNISFHISLTFF
jgi:hypothetical protein